MVCPICGEISCYRSIRGYSRGVISLFPFRKGLISIARFQCRKTKKTFSLLPSQLAPYHIYDIESMIWSVLLWCEVFRDEEGGPSTVIEQLPGDCDVSPWLLRNWVGLVNVGFQQTHAALCQWYDLSSIHSSSQSSLPLLEIYDFFLCLGSRGPPSRSAFMKIVDKYSRHTSRFFLGIPSQGRRRLSA